MGNGLTYISAGVGISNIGVSYKSELSANANPIYILLGGGYEYMATKKLGIFSELNLELGTNFKLRSKNSVAEIGKARHGVQSIKIGIRYYFDWLDLNRAQAKLHHDKTLYNGSYFISILRHNLSSF